VSDIVLQTLREDLTDLADPTALTRVVLRLLIATALGACVGWEREISGKAAGLRTHMLVALGVALILVAAQQSGMPQADLSRVVQGVFAGIGFVGAAAIIKPSNDDHVRGVTTAASIWATAAIAAAAGLGRLGTAILATLIALVILIVLRRVERKSEQKALAGGPAAKP